MLMGRGAHSQNIRGFNPTKKVITGEGNIFVSMNYFFFTKFDLNYSYFLTSFEIFVC